MLGVVWPGLCVGASAVVRLLGEELSSDLLSRGGELEARELEHESREVRIVKRLWTPTPFPFWISLETLVL